MRTVLLLIGLVTGIALAQTNGGTGATLPATCVQGSMFVLTTTPVTPYVCSATNTWTAISGGEGGGLPAGMIGLVASGSCPQGYAEVSAFSGKFLLGTDASSGNVGSTGGADTITPEGVNSGGSVNAHSGTSVADHASHTHTYTQIPNHTHGLSFARGATTGGATTSQGFTSSNDTSSTAITNVTDNPSGGVATGTTAGPSAALTHSVTQPSNHTFTNPTFTGTEFDNRPAFVRVIACSKT